MWRILTQIKIVHLACYIIQRIILLNSWVLFTSISFSWLLLLIITCKFLILIWLSLFCLLVASNWLLLGNICCRNIEIVMMVQIATSRLIDCLIWWLVCANIMLKALDWMSTLIVSSSWITTWSYSIFTSWSSLSLLLLIFTRARTRIFTTFIDIWIRLT